MRELQNVIERSVVLANGNEHLGVNDLPEELRELTISDDAPVHPFHEALQGFKKELVRSALRANGGNKLRAAEELGISRCYLHRMLHQFGMVEKDAGQENDGLLSYGETDQADPNAASADAA